MKSMRGLDKLKKGEGINLNDVAIMLLLPLLLMYLGAFVMFVFKSNIQPWIFPLSVVASSAVVTFRRDFSRRSVVTVLSVILLIVLLTLLNGLYDDSSYDGNYYHQEIIVYLINGWNPLYVSVPAPDCSLWSMHYPMGMETIESCVVSTTGYIETGKVINMMLILGTMSLVQPFLQNMFPAISRFAKMCCTLLVGMNPVGMGQAPSFYVDYTAYYLAVVAIILSIYYVRNRKAMPAILLTGAIIVAAGIKYTVFFYVGFSIGSICLWLLWHRSYKETEALAVVAMVGVVLGVFVMGYHPYVTNYLDMGNPLYPLIGENSVDIMTNNTPIEFQAGNRLVNFVKSIFSLNIASVDERIGGFGFAMTPLLILSFVELWLGDRKNRCLFVYASVMTLISVFVFSQCWWARYVPQLWLVVVFGMVSFSLTANDRLKKVLMIATVTLALINSGAGFAFSLASDIRLSVIRHTIYQVHKEEGEIVEMYNASPAMKRHVEEQNLKYMEISYDELNKYNQAVCFLCSNFSKDATLVPFKDNVSAAELGIDGSLKNRILLRKRSYVTKVDAAWSE